MDRLVRSSLWNLFADDYTANCRAWKHFAGNPVVPPSGSGWEKRWTANPDLLIFQGRTLLYYRGNGTLTDDPDEPVHDRIGVAVLEDISGGSLTLRDLTGEQPVIDVGPAGTFDSTSVLDPATVVFEGKVWLYYSGDDPANTHTIGLAVSEDGIHFEKMGAVMPGRAPEVVLRDGTLHMFHQVFERSDEGVSYSTLYLSTSTDGRHFTATETDPIYPRPTDQWDSLSITTARIHEPGDGWYYMIYGGSSYLADEPDYFGLARSQNLIEWESHPGNPIFGTSAKGEPDGAAVWFPALYETDDHFVLLYEGSRGKYSWDLHSTICLSSLEKHEFGY